MSTICKKCVLHDGIPGVTIHEDGICSVCHRYYRYKETEPGIRAYLNQQLKNLCEQIKNKKNLYDVAVMFSGGKDSTILLKIAKEDLGLKPLAVSIIHPMMNEIAKHNVEIATYKMGIDLIKVHIPEEIYIKVMRQAILYAPRYGLNEFFGCSGCHFMMNWITIHYAMMLEIPLIFEGSDISQTGEAVFRSTEKIRSIIRKGENPFGMLNKMIYDALGESMPLYLQYNPEDILNKPFPNIISPHTFMDYDTMQSQEYISKLGLKSKDFKTIYTNCSAQPFFSCFSLRRFHCVSYIHHYATEIRRQYPNLMQMSLEDSNSSESVLSRETILKLIHEYEQVITYASSLELEACIPPEEKEKIRTLAPTYMQIYGREVCDVFLDDVLKIPYFCRFFNVDFQKIDWEEKVLTGGGR